MNLRARLLAFALLGGAAFAAAPAQAQVNVNVNIGQPAWGPAVPQGAQYYYIPEIDGYYDLYSQQYIVLRNGQWLPVAALNGYDPYQFHPVVLDYRGRQPWVYVGAHRDRYRPVVYRPGPPRGLPPGQAKKLYRQGYYDGRGLPPGQAKKLYRDGYNDGRDRDDDHGRGNGHGRGRD